MFYVNILKTFSKSNFGLKWSGRYVRDFVTFILQIINQFSFFICIDNHWVKI